MVKVCDGMKTQNDMLVEAIDQYREIFLKARRDFNKVISVGHGCLISARWC
jgi:DNA topoisomerase-3